MCSKVEYFCSSCQTYREELSDITPVEICRECAGQLEEDTFLFI